MDFWDLTKLLGRRWYVTIPLLILTVGGVLGVHQVVKPKWIATSYIQLVAPANQTAPGQLGADQRNPWIAQGLYSLANAGMLTVGDQSVIEDLNNQGLSDTFTTTLGSGLPTVTFEVTATTQQIALDTTKVLIEDFTKSINELQNGVQPADRITTLRLDNGGNLKPSSSNVKRALIAVGGAGLILAIGLTVAVDGVIRSRARRRLARESNDLVPGLEPERGGRWKDPYVTANNRQVPAPQPQLAPRTDEPVRPASDGRGVPTIVVSYSQSQPNGRSESGWTSPPPASSPPAESSPVDSTVVLPLRHGSRPSGSSRSEN